MVKSNFLVQGERLETLVVRILQPDPDKMKLLYGDPRGSFESLESRRKWYHGHFSTDGDLDMKAWKEVFHLDIAHFPYFGDVRKAMEQVNPGKALDVLFHLFNLDVGTMVQVFGYTGYSMSVGHVVEFSSGLDAMLWYCDGIGWERIYPVNVPLGFEVGGGATKYGYSDRYPYYISRISPSGKTIWIKRADYEVVKKDGGYSPGDHKDYTFTPNPDAPEEMCRKRSNGRWYTSDAVVSLRHIEKYEDPHF